MGDQFPEIRSVETPKRVAVRDVLLVVAAMTGVVFANVGVVRALDVALDAIHR